MEHSLEYLRIVLQMSQIRAQITEIDKAISGAQEHDRLDKMRLEAMQKVKRLIIRMEILHQRIAREYIRSSRCIEAQSTSSIFRAIQEIEALQYISYTHVELLLK